MPASRIDTQPRACLATIASSNSEETDRAWTGLKSAAKKDSTLVIQRFGAPTGTTPTALLATLAQMRCTVIVAVGDDLAQADASVPGAAGHVIAITTKAVHARALRDVAAASVTPGAVTAAVPQVAGQR